ncbi:MAG: hypothetical protein JWO79_5108 [Actinomycetia bacterium]|nr:hypothetical protein [Actinomycetes bacterium]
MHRILVSTLAAAVLMLPAAPASAAPASGCAVMGDEAGVLGAGLPAVEAAAGRLAAAGAMVRVRAWRSVPGGDLDQFAAHESVRCGWRQSSSLNPRLILVTVAVTDRHTGLYYGANWATALDGQWDRIQQQDMNPHFQAGDFAAGLAGGLDGITQQITDAAAPPGDTAPGGIAPGDTAPGDQYQGQDVPDGLYQDGTPVDSPEAPVFALLPLLILSIGVCVLLGFFGYRFRRRSQARRWALASAEEARRAEATLSAALASLATAEAPVEDAGEGAQVATVRAEAASARRSAEGALRRIRELAGPYAPELLRRASSALAGVAVTRWDDATAQASAATNAVTAATASMTSLSELLAATPQRIAELGRRHSAAATAIARLAADGWKTVDLTAAHERSGGLVARASKRIAAGQRGLALDGATEATRSLDELDAAVTGLPSRRTRILDAVADLRTRVPAAAADAGAARDLVGTLDRNYGEACASDLARPADPLVEPVAQAEAAASMQVQDWDAAERLCAEVAAACEAATGARTAAQARAAELTWIATELPRTLAAAGSATEDARARIGYYAAELPPRLADELAATDRRLASLTTLATGSRPPLLTLHRDLVTHTTDAYALAGRAEQIHGEALAAAESAAEAAREIRRLDSALGWQLFGASASTARQAAETLLARANAAGRFDYATRIDLARRAAATAVAARHQLEAERARHRAATAFSSSSSSSSFSSNSSSSSGSSSSGSSMGGGSTSW